MSLLATLVLCAATAPERRDVPELRDTILELERSGEGDLLCTLQAEGVYAIDLLIELADLLERSIEGLELLERAGTVRVDLRRRPVEQALTYVLGACGLRGRLTSAALVVQADHGPQAELEVLEDAAELAYLRALRSFPRSPDAPRSELALARIQERRGNLAAARGHYELLVQEHPKSELVPHALLRSAELLAELERWSEAYEEYSSLLNLEREHPYGVEARLALARLSVELGDPQRGLYVLENLEAALPATDSADLAERLRVRALCLDRLGSPMDALRLVDQAERIEGETLESLELRASALERSDRPGEAVRAWLTLGERATGARLARSFSNAARLAYGLGDDLGVLFVARRAEARGVGGEVAAWVEQARERLGLGSGALSGSPLDEELAHAEALLEEGLPQQAYDAARLLLSPAVMLDEDQLLRASETFARAASDLDRLEDGMAKLRHALDVLRDPERRKRIYVLAGELYEARGRFEDAIDAYEGRL